MKYFHQFPQIHCSKTHASATTSCTCILILMAFSFTLLCHFPTILHDYIPHSLIHTLTKFIHINTGPFCVQYKLYLIGPTLVVQCRIKNKCYNTILMINS